MSMATICRDIQSSQAQNYKPSHNGHQLVDVEQGPQLFRRRPTSANLVTAEKFQLVSGLNVSQLHSRGQTKTYQNLIHPQAFSGLLPPRNGLQRLLWPMATSNVYMIYMVIMIVTSGFRPDNSNPLSSDYGKKQAIDPIIRSVTTVTI